MFLTTKDTKKRESGKPRPTRAFLPVLCLILTACPHFSPEAPSRETEVAGTFSHFQSGFHFPDTIGNFTRGGVTLFRPDSADVGIGYGVRTQDMVITATLYLTRASLFTWHTPDTLLENFESAAGHIRNRYRNVKTVLTEEAAFAGHRGKTALFLYELPEQDGTVQSEMRLFYLDGWLLKYRITYPVAQADYIRRDLDQLVRGMERNYRPEH